MSLTLNVSPVDYNLSKSPMWAKITTNNYVVNPGIKASLTLLVDNLTLNAAGGTFKFTWATGSVTFTIVAGIPTNPGVQVPAYGGGMPDPDYSALLVTYFKLNYLLSDLFDITVEVGSSTYILFVAKNLGLDLDLSPSTLLNTGYVTDVPIAPEAYQVQSNYKMLLDVFIESIHNSGVYSKIGSQELDPVGNICIFDISRMINASLLYLLPISNTLIPFENKDSIKKFYIKYAEKYGSPVVAGMVSETSPTEVLKAGLPYMQAALITDAINYLYIGEQVFLTRQSRTKKVIATQQEFLSWICPPVDAYFAAHSLQSKVYIETVISFVNNATPVVLPSAPYAVNERELWAFPVSFTALAIAALGAGYSFDKIAKYTVTLKWYYPGAPPAVSETFTFLCDHDSYIDNRMFLFTNSDGGIDTFRATGMKTTNSQIDGDVLNIRKNYGYGPNDGEYAEFNKNKKEIIIQNTGFINRDQQKWLDDFILAERKWEVLDDNTFAPIVITASAEASASSSTITKAFDQSKLQPLSFDFYYFHAYNDCVVKSNELQ